MKRRTGIATIAVVSALLAGCGGGENDTEDTSTAATSCEKEDRDEPYTAGITKTGTNGVSVNIASSDPAPPALFDNVWVLEITDAGGQPVDGATVAVEPFMPDHNHPTSTPAVITPQGNGRYEASPVYFMMPAYWEVTVRVTTGTVMDEVVFKLCID